MLKPYEQEQLHVRKVICLWKVDGFCRESLVFHVRVIGLVIPENILNKSLKFNPVALTIAKYPLSFGHSVCNTVKSRQKA